MPKPQSRDKSQSPRIEVEPTSGNVYADLGFPDAEQMPLKAQLVSKIAETLREHKWTQLTESKALGIPQPKLSRMLRRQFRGISETKILECLTRLGRDLPIVIGVEGSTAPVGIIEVLSA
jgi:predicted XRE-type DNA-binding protein